jgi:hypothetical protein
MNMARKRSHKRRNPGTLSLRSPVGAVKSAISKPVLSKTFSGSLGFIGNYLVRTKLLPKILPASIGGTVHDGVASYAWGIAGAAGLGALTAMAMPAQAASVFGGAMLEEGVRLLFNVGLKSTALNGLLGLNDDVTDYEGGGMNDYMNDYESAAAPAMADWDSGETVPVSW